MIQLPKLYSNHLNKEFNYSQYLILLIVINLLQKVKKVRLEELARSFPCPIQLRSRLKKLQRFLSLEQFKIERLWFPILQMWVNQEWEKEELIYLVIDRSQWRSINLLMVSLIYENRAIPIYFILLEGKGSSKLSQQKQVLEPVLKLLRDYKIVVLGDREFCGVELGKWLSSQQKVYISLRLRKNEYVELEERIWFPLTDLGLTPGMSVYYPGVKVTKSKGFKGFNLAAKWKRHYSGQSSQEPWFILTNLDSKSAAISAYSKRMGIEEMFRDLKGGGYNLEATQVQGERLIALIILITLAYSYSTVIGKTIKRKGVAQYVARPTEAQRTYRRHSSFSIGLNSINWLDSLTFFWDDMQKLISLTPHKKSYYRRGLRAATLIQSAL